VIQTRAALQSLRVTRTSWVPSPHGAGPARTRTRITCQPGVRAVGKLSDLSTIRLTSYPLVGRYEGVFSVHFCADPQPALLFEIPIPGKILDRCSL